MFRLRIANFVPSHDSAPVASVLIADFLQNWLGVSPVCFLNTVLKVDLELNPTAKAISNTLPD